MSHKNNIQFTMTFSVSAEHVAEAERIFKSHAKWMKKTHHKEGDKALLVYDLSVNPELENPMDPASKATGNTVFHVSEVYASQAGLDDHWNRASAWEDFDGLNELIENSTMSMINGAPITRSLW